MSCNRINKIADPSRKHSDSSIDAQADLSLHFKYSSAPDKKG